MIDLKRLIDFCKRAVEEYRRELDKKEVVWGAPLKDDAPKSITAREFYIEHFPIAQEFRPVMFVTVKSYDKEYATTFVRTRRFRKLQRREVSRWKEKVTITKYYLHMLPMWLSPSPVRGSFGLTVDCKLPDGAVWMTPSESEARKSAPPCSSREDAMKLITLYRETVLWEGVIEEKIEQ